jgi:hypothetical protein
MTQQNITDDTSPEAPLLELIGKWRAKRARLTERGGGPVPPSSKATTLLHVIPAHAFVRRSTTEPWKVPEQTQERIYVPHGGTRHQYNEDGFIRIAGLSKDGPAFGYTQIFRSGITEYANCNCFGQVDSNHGEMLWGLTIEQEIVRCYENAIKRIGSNPPTSPVYLGLSLIGIEGKRIYSTYNHSFFQDSIVSPRKNIFNSPERVVDLDAEDSPYTKTLLPLVNLMWQAFGHELTPFRINAEWNPFGNYR